MKKAKEQFNKYAEQIEDAQTEIRKIIVMAFLLSIPFFSLNRLIKNIVVEYTDNIKIPDLKDGAVRGLIAFANRQNAGIRKIGLNPKTVKFIAENKDRRFPTKPTENVIKDLDMPPVTDLGVPLKQYYQEVFKTKIKPTLDRLCEQVALDPNDLTGRNSLRNFAEMEVRYNDHLEQIEELKNSGTKIVVSSAHADCSDRCAPWQGRLYSLDGTSGKIDGKEYVPLERATDIYYTTKAGKVYKNGLLGFNCFDKETEIYTSFGWKKFSELNGTENIYTLNTKTKKTEWQTAERYYRAKNKQDMIHFKSNTVDLLVTNNHNVLYFTTKDKTLRFSEACNLPKTAVLYGGEEYDGKDIESVYFGGKQVDGDTFCKFIAYYLADGSLHDNYSVKIAQTDNEKMYKELKALPFTVWRDKEKIVIHGKSVADELKSFGTCADKFIPDIIFKMSRRQINIFLSSYIKTDGYTSKPRTINGYERKPHLQVFTTSKRLADGLSELAMKAGYRPKVEQREPSGKEIRFPNGTYKSKLILYVIHLNRSLNAGNLKREIVPYNDFVYCVEVPNHTLLVRRNGKIIWCGNCRHYLEKYEGKMLPTISAEERKIEYGITIEQRRLERLVRRERIKAAVLNNIDAKGYQEAKRKAAELYLNYKRYSINHNRAFYPMRAKI